MRMSMRQWLWRVQTARSVLVVWARLRLLPSAAFAMMMVLGLGACSSLGSGGGLWNIGSSSADADAYVAGGLAAASDGSLSGAAGVTPARAGHDNTPETSNVVPQKRLHCIDVRAADLSQTFQRLATHYGMRLEWTPEDDRRIVQSYKVRFDCFEEALHQLLLMNPSLVADIYYPNRVMVVRDADRHTTIDKTPLRCATSPVRLERALPACQGETLRSRTAAADEIVKPTLSRSERRRRARQERRADRAASARSERSKRSSRKQWVVRVAVYDSDAGAQRMLSRLLADNFTAYLQSVQRGSRVFSGLYVGRDMSTRQASRMSKTLDRRYGLATLAVQRSNPDPASHAESAASNAASQLEESK